MCVPRDTYVSLDNSVHFCTDIISFFLLIWHFIQMLQCYDGLELAGEVKFVRTALSSKRSDFVGLAYIHRFFVTGNYNRMICCKR